MRPRGCKHPLAIRWAHWVNVPVLAVMVWSGLLIYWANDAYRIGWGDRTLVRLFPQMFYAPPNPLGSTVPRDPLWRLDYRLAEGMAWHFTFMWLFVANGLLYGVALAFTGRWRDVVPKRGSLREALLIILHDLRLSKSPPVRDLYNAAQRCAYTSVILMGVGSVATGLAIYRPTQLSWLTTSLGGYAAARIEHFVLAVLFTLFVAVHLVQVLRAGWPRLRGMITGQVVADAAAGDM